MNLDDLIREGIKDSSGTFTVSKEKALEKMSAFHLPSDTAWVLKVVQAAVASTCTEIDVRQTSTATEFHLSGPTGWTLTQLENEFYQIERSPLDHLKHGLWNVSLNGMRPFSLSLPNYPEMLFWDGEKMARKPAKPVAKTVLAVSHRTRQEGRGIPILSNIEAASKNAAVAKELTQSGFTCSKPLRLDNRRLDALQLCPVHGLSSSSYPVQMGFLKGDLPELVLPDATISGFTKPKEVDPGMLKVFQAEATIPSRLALVCMVTAHLRKVTKGKTTVWDSYHCESLIYWVRDGVVVDRTRPKVGSSGCCSIAIFASADGLRSDAGGFVLLKDDGFAARENEVCQLAAEFVAQVNLRMQPLVDDARRTTRVLSGLATLGGIGVAFASPAHGIAITMMGAYSFFTAGANEVEISDRAATGLRDLQKHWSIRYPRRT